MAATHRPDVVTTYREHLSSGRALLGSMFGDHLEGDSHGAVLRTIDGREFLNCAGYGVFLLGATHPHVVDRVVEQIRRHPLSTRVLLDPESAHAAEALVAVAPPGLRKVHFTGSGTEATEAALKLARAHGKRRLVAAENGYHGKTMGALSVTMRDVHQRPFRPLLDDVISVPYGDAAALDRALRDGPPATVILEPVQGEGGVIFPAVGYLSDAGRICREHDAFLIVDEVLTGLGRLGRWWGIDYQDVRPDALLVGKGLSGGVVPVSAVLATPEAYEPFDKDPLLHTSTFAGAPIAMAAARAAIEAMVADDAVGRAAQLGRRLHRDIATHARVCPHLITEVRGEGLLIAVEFADAGLVGEALLELVDRGVLVNHSLNNTRVVRLTPPVTLTTAQLDYLGHAFGATFGALASRFPVATR